MSYLVLARKYRPQTFDEVIKQDHVTRTLANAISSDRVAHAILFSGPRGTGKTTVARILAKAMNCKNGPTPIPCNECRFCSEITSGGSADVFEIDGASNNSVDQIRELRENIKYMPAYSLYKIYIIDEVHMLSLAAFNALLKTLEEPPSHVMFIFATTEPHKIPITILSRCRRHDFRRIDTESILQHMQMICTSEGFQIGVESLSLIAREADGSVRDALSLLDQVMTCSEGTITHDQILNVLGVIDRKTLFDISKAVLHGDIPELLDILDASYDRGYDMKKLYANFVEHFRNLLVVKMGKKVPKLVDLPAYEIDLMVEQVKDVSSSFLSQIFDLLFKEEAAIRLSANPKLAIEISLIRIFQVKPALPIDMLIEKLDSLRTEIHETQADYGDANTESTFHNKMKSSQKTSSRVKDIETSKEPIFATTFDPKEGLDKTWEKIVDIISEKHPSLAANLINCTLKKLTNQNLEIEVIDNGFNINMIKRQKNMAILKKTFSDFLGKEIEIIVTVSNKQKYNDYQKKSQISRLKQDALNHPLVTDVLEIFNGKLLDVKIL